MSNQHEIGWCDCCGKAVIEIRSGICSNCFNHTMGVVSAYDYNEIIDALEGLIKNPNSGLYHNVAKSVLLKHKGE